MTSLKAAIADARRGELFPQGDIAIGVSEEVVRSAVSPALPIEKPVGTEFMARIHRGDGAFR